MRAPWPATTPPSRQHGRCFGQPRPDATRGARLGPFFAQQINAEALTATPPVRVVAVHRSGLRVTDDGIDEVIPPGIKATVGDWLLLDSARPRASRVLSRKSLVKRCAPGTDRQGAV